jgi:hypothetical protein
MGVGRVGAAGAPAAARAPPVDEVEGELTAEGLPAVPAVWATGAAGAGVAAATAAGEGILMVGAAVGFGGRLIRTVSFLGWTFADSEGFGGIGIFGGLSAIMVFSIFGST